MKPFLISQGKCPLKSIHNYFQNPADDFNLIKNFPSSLFIPNNSKNNNNPQEPNTSDGQKRAAGCFAPTCPLLIQPCWQQMAVSPTMPRVRRCQHTRWQTLCRGLRLCVHGLCMCVCLCAQKASSPCNDRKVLLIVEDNLQDGGAIKRMGRHNLAKSILSNHHLYKEILPVTPNYLSI